MTNHEQYLNLVDELLARGVSPDIAVKISLKLNGETETATRYSEDFLPKLKMTGTAGEILEAAKKCEPGRFGGISVTILSAALRGRAANGDHRVKILPKSPLSKKSVRFVLNN
jgi:hypothetical protein